jgi:hypothetical protein
MKCIILPVKCIHYVKIPVVLFFSLWLTQGFAQDTEIPKTAIHTNLSISIGINQYAGALSAFRIHGIGKKHKIQIGYGLRYSAYLANDQIFESAPPELRKDKNKIAEYVLEQSQVHAFNTAVFLQYAFSPKFEAGFNIDVLGFSFGKEQTGRLTAGQIGSTEVAKPTPFNVLLIGNNDMGSLNSEFTLRYWFHEKWGIKVAYTYFFVEYTTNRTIPDNFDNDRFRNKASLGLVGITYRPFKK